MDGVRFLPDIAVTVSISGKLFNTEAEGGSSFTVPGELGWPHRR